jgi:hypothetical protein
MLFSLTSKGSEKFDFLIYFLDLCSRSLAFYAFIAIADSRLVNCESSVVTVSLKMFTVQ